MRFPKPALSIEAKLKEYNEILEETTEEHMEL